MRNAPGWLPFAGLITSTWEPGRGDMSRWFFVPGGVWPPRFFSTFNSFPSDSLLLQPKGQVLGGCLKHTHSKPYNQPKRSFDLRGNMCPPLSSQAPGSENSK